jgi:hypothetical protein
VITKASVLNLNYESKKLCLCQKEFWKRSSG